MASVDVASLSKAEHDELCCAYAALLLHDGEIEITGDKLAKVIKASGNEVEAYWPTLFAKALKSANVNDLLSNIGSAAPAGGAAGPVAGATAAVAEVKEEKKEEVEDVDMGGLFGGDDDY